MPIGSKGTTGFVGGVINKSVTAKVTVLVAQAGAFPGNSYSNGVSGVGAQLTANANGPFPTVDDVTIPTGARILVRLEGIGNGYYNLIDSGSASTPWILERSPDADVAGEIDNNSNVWVSQGTLYGDQIFTLIYDGAFVVGTTVFDFRIASSSLTELGIKSSVTPNFVMNILNAEALTADHGITFNLDDADRTLALSADIALDQNLRITDSPTFAGLTSTGTIITNRLTERTLNAGVTVENLTITDEGTFVTMNTPYGSASIHFNEFGDNDTTIYSDNGGYANAVMTVGDSFLEMASYTFSPWTSHFIVPDAIADSIGVLTTSGFEYGIEIMQDGASEPSKNVSGGIHIKRVTTSALTSPITGVTDLGVIINSTSSTFATGFDNSVIIAGNKLVVNRSNTLFTGSIDIGGLSAGAQENKIYFDDVETGFPGSLEWNANTFIIADVGGNGFQIRTDDSNGITIGGAGPAGATYSFETGGKINVKSTGPTVISTFDWTQSTVPRTWTMPDASGTVALLSDVQASDTLSEILAIGNTTGANDIIVNSGQKIVTEKIEGSIVAAGTLTLSSTSNVIKGKILFGTSAYDEENNRLGIGTSTLNIESILELESTTKALRFTRMTTTQRTAMTGASGFIVLDTTLGFVFYHDGFNWVQF